MQKDKLRAVSCEPPDSQKNIPQGLSPCRTEPGRALHSGLWARRADKVEELGSGAGEPDADGRQASVARQWDALVQCLADVTQLKLNDKGLSPDFRLQLHLLECSIQQRKLMQKLADQQQLAFEQLNDIHRQGAERQDSLLQRTESVRQGLEQVKSHLELHCLPRELPDAKGESPGAEGPKEALSVVPCAPCTWNTGLASSGVKIDLPTGPSEHDQVSWRKDEEGGLQSRDLDQSWPLDIGGGFQAPLKDDFEVPVTRPSSKEKPSRSGSKERRSITSTPSTVSSNGGDDEAEKKGALERALGSTWFDMICGAIIVSNAMTIGMSAQASMDQALVGPGKSEESLNPDTLATLGYFFTTFYAVELLAKFWVFRFHIFSGELGRWNLFDAMLVLLSLWDLLVSHVDFMGNASADVTWLRILRLTKMVRLLRVVRIMRLFKVLRMMVSSIAMSFTVLLWSLLMIFLINYIFSVLFLQVLSSHLLERKGVGVTEDFRLNIRENWSSIYGGISTLFMAVTGGMDWADLASPLREVGEVYHLLFMFYIAFTVFAVLNVLTGLYVDSAQRVSDSDQTEVGESLKQQPQTEAFRVFLHTICDEYDQLNLHDLMHHRNQEEVKQFLTMADMTPENLKDIFCHLDLQDEGRVGIEQFIEGCVHFSGNNANMAAVGLGMVSIAQGNKRCAESVKEVQAALRELRRFLHEDSGNSQRPSQEGIGRDVHAQKVMGA